MFAPSRSSTAAFLMYLPFSSVVLHLFPSSIPPYASAALTGHSTLSTRHYLISLLSLILYWTLLPRWIFYTSADLLLFVPLSRHVPPSSPSYPSSSYPLLFCFLFNQHAAYYILTRSDAAFRYNKCKMCYKILMDIRSGFGQKQTNQGKLASTFRELNILMSQLD